MHQLRQQSDRDASPTRPASWSPDGDPEVDIAAIHNYDHWEGHSVEVTVVAPDGEPVTRERRYLSPGRSARLSATVTPGEYELRVLVDGVERARTALRIGDSTSASPVVELGNGAVSVTGGATNRKRVT